MQVWQVLVDASLVGLDVWLYKLDPPARWQGYAWAATLLVGIYLSPWGATNGGIPIAGLVCLLVAALIHESWVRYPQSRGESAAERHDRAQLEIRFETSGAYRRSHGAYTFIRFGVYNAADVVAQNVEAFLIEIQPQPSWAAFDPDLPYRVRRSDLASENGNHSINPRLEERFDILWFWMTGEGNMLMVDGVDTKRVLPTVPSRTRNEAAFVMAPNEHWHMTYRITSANGGERTIVFFVERVGNEVRATLPTLLASQTV